MMKFETKSFLSLFSKLKSFNFFIARISIETSCNRKALTQTDTNSNRLLDSLF